MKRVEFDYKVSELKNKRYNAIREILSIQQEIKEEIASRSRQIHEIEKEISKLKQSLNGYHLRRIAVEKEWNDTIQNFIRENVSNTTSNLSEATTTNIIYELRRRGFRGVIHNDNEGESYDINKEWHNDNSETETDKD